MKDIMFRSMMLALTALNFEQAYECYKLWKMKKHIDKKYRKR